MINVDQLSINDDLHRLTNNVDSGIYVQEILEALICPHLIAFKTIEPILR